MYRLDNKKDYKVKLYLPHSWNDNEQLKCKEL